jgi:hypothetical protein
MTHQCPYCGDTVEAPDHGPVEVLSSCFCSPDCEGLFKRHFMKKEVVL